MRSTAVTRTAWPRAGARGRFHALVGSTHANGEHRALQLLHEVLKTYRMITPKGCGDDAGCAVAVARRLREAKSHLTYAVAIFLPEKCPDMTGNLEPVQYLAYSLRNLGEYAQVRTWLEEIQDGGSRAVTCTR